MISFDPQYALDLASSRMLHRVTPLDVTAAFAAPYSGATLFAILLARHPDVSCDGETFPWVTEKPVLCSCGKPQIDCPYYREAAVHFLRADGRTWDDRLFTAHPHYSRLELLNKVIGRQWRQGFLGALQHYLRSAVPGLRRLDRDFVNAHLQFVENSLRLRGISDQDFLERMARSDELADHDGETCGQCHYMILGADVAREMIEAGDYEDVVSKWATEHKRRWEKSKFFKLWKKEQKAGRDPSKAFKDRGWEP